MRVGHYAPGRIAPLVGTVEVDGWALPAGGVEIDGWRCKPDAEQAGLRDRVTFTVRSGASTVQFALTREHCAALASLLLDCADTIPREDTVPAALLSRCSRPGCVPHANDGRRCTRCD